MRKIVLALIIILVSVSVCFGASTKISELTETQTLTDDDLFLVSTYLTGSYTSKYITTQYVKSALGVMTIANDTLWDAAGDLVYGTGANTGSRLAIGAPYALLMTNAGATAPAWTYTIGATGTRFTAGFFTDLTVTNAIAGSVTGNAGTATALAADPADCAAGQVATGIAASGALSCTATPSVTTLTGAVTGTASGNIANTLADAAGDIIQGSADNTWARLAIGTAYQIPHVNSGATALAYTSTLGSTSTRLTKIWATDLELTNAPTIGGAAWTTILQPLNDDLTTLSSGGTANCIWGEKSDSSGIECKTTFNAQFDDTAAQFNSATESKGTLKFDQTGISDTKLVTVKYTATDSYTYTPTLVGNVSHLLGTTWTNGKWCSYSTSTGLTCNEDAPAGSGDVTGTGDCTGGDCFDGSSDGGTYIRLYDGTSAYTALTAAVRKFTISSSVADSEDLAITLGNNDNKVTVSSSTGVTEANFSALNLVTTGTVSGKIPMISKSGNYTLGTDNAQEAYGYMVWLTGDGTILTLPAVAAGMSVCVYSADSYDKVVNPNDNDGIRNGTTTRNAEGHSITSGATDQASFVCLVADSADGWTVLGKAGTWTDE